MRKYDKLIDFKLLIYFELLQYVCLIYVLYKKTIINTIFSGVNQQIVENWKIFAATVPSVN